MAEKVDTKEEGEVYVASTGATYSAPKFDAETVRKYRENIYLAGALDKQQRTLFRDRKDFAVYAIDPDTNEPDLDISHRMLTMVKAAEVDLWNKAQICWRESATWGPALFNPVWGYKGNEYVLLKLRHLPSEKFAQPGNTFSYIRNELLPGICLNDEGKIEFWQRQANGQVKKLENVVMMTDPVRLGLGGTPLIKPVIPVIRMLDFSWTGQMQQNNRLGAGGLFFIRVSRPQRDDVEYAQKIIKNINRGVAYQLRENMELVNLGLAETATALETIQALDQLIGNYFSPTKAISKDGTLIGGSSNPEYDLYMSYIQGQQSWVEAAFEYLLQPYLDVNGYDGYRVMIDIPAPQIEKSELWLRVAEIGYKTQSMGVAERRKILSWTGADLVELKDEEIDKLLEEFSKTAAPAAEFQRAELLAKVMNADPLDPYSIVDRETAQKVVRSSLKIQSGEE